MILTTLLLCVVVLGLMVYRYDLFDREPWFMLLLAILVGAGLMVIFQFWSGRTAAWLGAGDLAAASAAASHEEFAKVLAVALLALACRRWFNDPMDGIVYGSFAGLGAAIAESITIGRMYGVEALIVERELVRLVGHLVMGGIGGFGIGAMLRSRRTGLVLIPICLLLAFLIHFFWDLLAFAINDAGRSRPLQTLAAVCIMLTGLATYGCMINVGFCWSRECFDPDSPVRLTQWPFSLLKRRQGAPVRPKRPEGTSRIEPP